MGISRLSSSGARSCTLPRVRTTDPLWYLFTKRLLDILGATAAIVIAAPIMVVAVIAVRLETPGPVFFRQYRLGRNGRPFLLYKIRSMTASAPDIRDSLEDDNEASGPVFKIKADPRITRVGRVLRKYSIDEMPQLFHVLFGQMSLVGPRPPIPAEVERYEPWQTERLAVKPGLTCIWQVSGRSDIGFDEWIRMDIEYVRNRNLWLDIKLLLLTIPAVLTARGAY
ncbi:MAG: sugar transferase [Armatimonadetes bacterium]|nr:sugar transferase [Armatimonadota bacterium]MDI9586807.1 sugar transferase [Acidobacteriota bacterium]